MIETVKVLEWVRFSSQYSCRQADHSGSSVKAMALFIMLTNATVTRPPQLLPCRDYANYLS